jgi:hypothetical protein
MTAASNADAYAATRVGVYFPGFPSTLDGQCVSLIKWFLGEMCEVSDWKAARGDAKDYGDTLVRQGLADPASANQRKRGDIVVWKRDGGGYGHIGVLLTGDMVFEENVGLIGTPSKMVGDFRVYSSRIDPLSASWRTGSPTFYRVKSYIENKSKGATMDPDWQRQVSRLAYGLYLNRGLSVTEFKSRDDAKDPDDIMKVIASSTEAFLEWKKMAKQLGVTVTDEQIKAWQKDYLNQWPAKTLSRMAVDVKPAIVKPTVLKPGTYTVQ